MTPWQSGCADGLHIGDYFRRGQGDPVGLANYLKLNPLPTAPCAEWLDGFQFGMHDAFPQFTTLSDGTTVPVKVLPKHVLEAAEADALATIDYADEDDDPEEAAAEMASWVAEYYNIR